MPELVFSKEITSNSVEYNFTKPISEYDYLLIIATLNEGGGTEHATDVIYRSLGFDAVYLKTKSYSNNYVNIISVSIRNDNVFLAYSQDTQAKYLKIYGCKF